MSFNCYPIKVEVFGCSTSLNEENDVENLKKNKSKNNGEKLNLEEPEFVNIKIESCCDETLEQKPHITEYQISVKNEPSISFDISVKHEPVDFDITDEPLEVPEKENDNYILPDVLPLKPPNDYDISNHLVTENSENELKIVNAKIVVDVHHGYNTSIKTNPAKTAAERMRKYRYQMKKKHELAKNSNIYQDVVLVEDRDFESLELQDADMKQAKTAAERMREYRARKRKKLKTAYISASDENESVDSKKEENYKTDIGRPCIAKTVTERVREFRARKRGNIIPKQAKTAKECMQEYRARKKNKTHLIVDINSTNQLKNNSMIDSVKNNIT